MAGVAVLGYGTVGSGVVEALDTNSDIISVRSGEDVKVKYVLDIRDFPEDPVQKLIVHDFDIILNDDDIKVVAEVMGGIEPALTFTKSCLMKGKSVVTSNKELVAKHGASLIALARENGANYMFEASVGGGIPIIRPLTQCLAGDEICEIRGILNGTTNFILTKMEKDGLSFQEALKTAQEMGYAERKPDADVLGHDACRKTAILSSLAYGGSVDFEDIHTEGITEITFSDIKYAQKMNGIIKLIGRSKKENGRIYAIVSPVIISRDNPLSAVSDVFNAILVSGNIIGDAMFYGRGAGKLPTASAVISDIIECVKHDGKNITQFWTEKKIELSDIGEICSDFLIRFAKNGYEKNAEEITKRFGFGCCETVTAEGIDDETAIIVRNVKEKELSDFRGLFAEIILSAIRIEGI